MATALVTGGSSGIGLAFAHALAARGDDLVLVARDGSRLDAAAQQLRARHGVAVETLPADLADVAGIRTVEAFIDAHEIDVLVNSAGFAAHADLLDADWSGHAGALTAMALAVLVLSGAAGRQMVRRGAGGIVNVASVNALIDADVYSATKRWVVSYTEALAGRLAGTGVHATVVLPGWARTNYHAAAGMRRPPDGLRRHLHPARVEGRERLGGHLLGLDPGPARQARAGCRSRRRPSGGRPPGH